MISRSHVKGEEQKRTHCHSCCEKLQQCQNKNQMYIKILYLSKVSAQSGPMKLQKCQVLNTTQHFKTNSLVDPDAVVTVFEAKSVKLHPLKLLSQASLILPAFSGFPLCGQNTITDIWICKKISYQLSLLLSQRPRSGMCWRSSCLES